VLLTLPATSLCRPSPASPPVFSCVNRHQARGWDFFQVRTLCVKTFLALVKQPRNKSNRKCLCIWSLTVHFLVRFRWMVLRPSRWKPAIWRPRSYKVRIRLAGLASNPQWDHLREHLLETMFCSNQTRFPVDFPPTNSRNTIFAHLPGSLRFLLAVRVRWPCGRWLIASTKIALSQVFPRCRWDNKAPKRSANGQHFRWPQAMTSEVSSLMW
jgi:hypothetical protein